MAENAPPTNQPETTPEVTPAPPVPVAGETRECPNPDCVAVIGVSEKNCPSCGVDIAELDEQIEVIERARRAVRKKNKKKIAETVVDPEPVTPKKKSILANLIPRK